MPPGRPPNFLDRQSNFMLFATCNSQHEYVKTGSNVKAYVCLVIVVAKNENKHAKNGSGDTVEILKEIVCLLVRKNDSRNVSCILFTVLLN